MDNKTVVVLGVKRFSFANRETGEMVEGCNVFYYDPDLVQTKDEKGYMTAKAFLPLDHFDKFDGEFPQTHKIEMSLRLQGNKPTLKVSGFTRVEENANRK